MPCGRFILRTANKGAKADGRIGNSNGILALALPERNPENTPGASSRRPPATAPGAWHWRRPQPGVARLSVAWTCGSGSSKVEPQGFPGVEDLGTTSWGKRGGLLDTLPEDSPFLQIDPPQRRQQTLAGLKRILVRESQAQPLLLVFEDLHWIDSETQALLDSLIESLPTSCWASGPTGPSTSPARSA